MLPIIHNLTVMPRFSHPKIMHVSSSGADGNSTTRSSVGVTPCEGITQVPGSLVFPDVVFPATNLLGVNPSDFRHDLGYKVI